MDEDERPYQDSRAKEAEDLAEHSGNGKRQAGPAAGKIKYPHSELIDRLSNEHAHALTARDAEKKCAELIIAIYECYKPQINRLVRKYGSLTGTSDEEDMRQTAYLGLLNLLRSYQNSIHTGMKLSSFLDWKIRNACQQAANNTKDSFMEVTAPDGTLYRRMPHNEWLAKKRKLMPRGYTATPVRPQQLSALFGNDGGPDDNISTSLMDMDEPLVESIFPMEEDEPFVEPDEDAGREIDTVYRTARHIDIGSPENMHVLRKVYNLCHPYLLALGLKNTSGVGPESPFQHIVETLIIMTWKTYEKNNTMPGARYSFFLESAMRRKLSVLLGRE